VAALLPQQRRSIAMTKIRSRYRLRFQARHWWSFRFASRILPELTDLV